MDRSDLPQAESHPQPKPNKRRTRRQVPKSSTKAKAHRNAYGFGPNIALKILDVSESGVRLIVKEEMVIGQEFEVNLECVGGTRVKMIAVMVWQVPAEDGTYVIGARFEKSLRYRDLMTIARI